MTLARKLLGMANETGRVPSFIRRAVERDERGEGSREGDPVGLIEAFTRPYFALNARVRAEIAGTLAA